MRCPDCRIPVTGGTYCLDCAERRARPAALYREVMGETARRYRREDYSEQPHAGRRRARFCGLGLAAWHRRCAAEILGPWLRDERRLTRQALEDVKVELAAAWRIVREIGAETRAPVLP